MTGPRILSAEDLDLTERAARAAGFEATRFRARELEVIHINMGGWTRQFDPLNSLTEAFLLQVRMCMTVDVGTDSHVTAKTPLAPPAREPLGTADVLDAAAVACRAIVMAAALHYHEGV